MQAIKTFVCGLFSREKQQPEKRYRLIGGNVYPTTNEPSIRTNIYEYLFQDTNGMFFLMELSLGRCNVYRFYDYEIDCLFKPASDSIFIDELPLCDTTNFCCPFVGFNIDKENPNLNNLSMILNYLEPKDIEDPRIPLWCYF